MAAIGGLTPIVNENGPGDFMGRGGLLGAHIMATGGSGSTPGAGLTTGAPAGLTPPGVATGTPGPNSGKLPSAHIMASPSPGTSPTGLAPPATSPAPQNGASPNDAVPVPSAPVAAPGGLTNINTGQTSSAIGTPQGYSVGQGVDTSATSFLPTGITADTFNNIPLQTATAPGAQTYINSLQGQAQGPTNWNVTPQQTVQGQYAQLMAKGNPAIQAAEQQVIRQYAGAGGNNSLMAQTAAATSGSQVALQIATQDAQTYAAAGQYNATVANNFATAMNNYTASMLSSQQSFDQGVAQLTNQSNANMRALYGQVVEGAAAASESVKENLDNVQISTNATLEQMDKTFAQSVQKAQMQNQFANENAWTNYGMQVRTAYLASVNQQQTSLMSTIAAINSNPNISSAQAQAGIQSAVDQFNSFMTMNNAYYTSMVPGSNAATYQAYNTQGWPNN